MSCAGSMFNSFLLESKVILHTEHQALCCFSGIDSSQSQHTSVFNKSAQKISLSSFTDHATLTLLDVESMFKTWLILVICQRTKQKYPQPTLKFLFCITDCPRATGHQLFCHLYNRTVTIMTSQQLQLATVPSW
jgi:hypothetical protein